MFVKAIQSVSGFVRAIHSISRNFGQTKITPGAATLFFVNDEGWALTCKHVAQWITQANTINQTYDYFLRESRENSASKRSQLARKLGLSEEKTAEMRITFVDCVDQIKNLKFIVHPTYDLALIKFEGFTKRMYSGSPLFLGAESEIQPGMMACRLGFPFPEFSNFRLDPHSQTLKWIQSGNPRSPRFPSEGMVTRFIGDQNGKLYGIEMSTPGLRGQSGGPLFDTEGRIIGMQSRTKHLHLGFDIEDKDIIAHGKAKKVNDYAFIHLGECVHVGVIKEFLAANKVSFQTA
ncbi:S1 family peptidase [Algoriphagus namhaensis]